MTRKILEFAAAAFLSMASVASAQPPTPAASDELAVHEGRLFRAGADRADQVYGLILLRAGAPENAAICKEYTAVFHPVIGNTSKIAVYWPVAKGVDHLEAGDCAKINSQDSGLYDNDDTWGAQALQLDPDSAYLVLVRQVSVYGLGGRYTCAYNEGFYPLSGLDDNALRQKLGYFDRYMDFNPADWSPGQQIDDSPAATPGLLLILPPFLVTFAAKNIVRTLPIAFFDKTSLQVGSCRSSGLLLPRSCHQAASMSLKARKTRSIDGFLCASGPSGASGWTSMVALASNSSTPPPGMTVKSTPA